MHIRSLFLFTSLVSLSIIGCSSDTSSGGGAGKGGGGGAGGASGAHQGGKNGGSPASEAGATEGGAAGDGETVDDGQAGDGEAGDDGQAGAAGAPGSLAIEATRRVLLISVDGLHELDLAKWITGHPSSTLAKLAASGVNYTAAHTPTPSDSFPGLLALVTGGNPISTGVFYDDSYDRTLYAPGSKCQGEPGTEIVFDESVEYDDSKLFSGGIDAANLPYAKDANGNCKVVYPHDFLKVNTVFEVVRASGGYTAWSDKHAAYDLVNGPSGNGVQDLYTPEINSLIVNGGVANGVNLAATKALCDGTNSLPVAKVTDYTTCGPAVMAYDDTKVQAIINQIDGKRSDGSAAAPVPTIFGMNFQAVSVGQKLPVGGYSDAAGTPSTLLASAIAHIDASLGKMVAELAAKGLEDSTLIVVSSKHGQSPIDPTQLHMEAGGNGTGDVADPVASMNTVDATVDNSPSTYVNPNSDSAYQTHGHLQTDDVGLLWLQDQTKAPAIVAKLQADAAAIHANTLSDGTIFTSNITSGAALAAIFGDPSVPNSIAAARAPNAFIQPNAGVVYSSSTKKISEHGGGTANDTGVALLISLPAFGKSHTVSSKVGTTQVAPTILRALGLDPQLLQSVTVEHTQVLPDLF
jgi:Type I phosphodiesterase / nucleotide pyrophosphatase